MQHSETYYKSIEVIRGIADTVMNFFELLFGIFKFCLLMLIMMLPWLLEGVINALLNIH